MKKLKKIMICVVVMLLLHIQITGQVLVDQFDYIEAETNKTVTIGLWKNNTSNNYSIKLVGGESTGSINGFQFTDEFVIGTTNVNLIQTIRTNTGAIIEMIFTIDNISNTSLIVTKLNKPMCATTQPCSGWNTGNNYIRLTWSNDATGPVDMSAPSIPPSYTWNNMNNSALVRTIGFPNGKIYQTNYKSSNFAPNISGAEVVLTDGTTQTVYIGDPSVSNKRTPMILTIDTNANIVIQAEPGVGINTYTPQVELEVNGIIKSTIRDQNGIVRECNTLTRGSIGYDYQDDDLKVCKLSGWSTIKTIP